MCSPDLFRLRDRLGLISNLLTIGLIVLFLELPFGTRVVTGKGSQYARGVMDSVIAVRQSGRTTYDLPKELPEVDGYIAVLHCYEIGNIWYVRPVGSVWWERFLVTDCASGSDSRTYDGLSGAQWMVKYNVLIEVDYNTAVRWRTVGRMIPVEVQVRLF